MRRASFWTVFWGIRLIVVIAAIMLLAVANAFVAPLAVHFETGPAKPEPTGYDGSTKVARPFVGLALSGGGARASVFSAAGMQALAERGLLDEVTHVSSVSGGGFPAAYLAKNPLPTCLSDATDGTTLNTCAMDYFADMQKTMRRSFFWEVEARQVLSPIRLFSPSLRLTSLQDSLQSKGFLNGLKFKDIQDTRAYYFNAISYDTGRRFVFSNDTIPHPDAAQSHLLPASLRTKSFSEIGVPQKTPGELPVALAVATSAAFPPYLGPATVQFNDANKEPKSFLHLGDGGIFENSGREMLREIILASPLKTPARIYAFDAGKVLDSATPLKTHDISIWSRDVSRLVDVVITYAGAQREFAFDELRAKHGLEIEEMVFTYTDVADIVAANPGVHPEWETWNEWRADCGVWARRSAPSPAQRLIKVPTALKISRCDAALIAQAARFLVDQKL